MAVFLARMVMPRSRSNSFESITRSTCCSLARQMPLWFSMASTRVVLPWSTCAMMAILRRLLLKTSGPFRRGNSGRESVSEISVYRIPCDRMSPRRTPFYLAGSKIRLKKLGRHAACRTIGWPDQRLAALATKTSPSQPDLGQRKRHGVAKTEKRAFSHSAQASDTESFHCRRWVIVVTLIGGATMKRRFPLFIICELLLATAALAQTQRANRVFPTPRVPRTYCRSRMIRHVCFSVAEKRCENGACNLYTWARILRIRAKGKDPRHCSVGGGHQCHRSRGNVV